MQPPAPVVVPVVAGVKDAIIVVVEVNGAPLIPGSPGSRTPFPLAVVDHVAEDVPAGRRRKCRRAPSPGRNCWAWDCSAGRSRPVRCSPRRRRIGRRSSRCRSSHRSRCRWRPATAFDQPGSIWNFCHVTPPSCSGAVELRVVVGDAVGAVAENAVVVTRIVPAGDDSAGESDPPQSACRNWLRIGLDGSSLTRIGPVQLAPLSSL